MRLGSVGKDGVEEALSAKGIMWVVDAVCIPCEPALERPAGCSESGFFMAHFCDVFGDWSLNETVVVCDGIAEVYSGDGYGSMVVIWDRAGSGFCNAVSGGGIEYYSCVEESDVLKP